MNRGELAGRVVGEIDPLFRNRSCSPRDARLLNARHPLQIVIGILVLKPCVRPDPTVREGQVSHRVVSQGKRIKMCGLFSG